MKPNRVNKESPKQNKLSPESKKSLKGKDSPKVSKSSGKLATKSVRTFEEMMAHLAIDGDTKPVKPILASEERVDALFNRVTTVDKTLKNLTDGLKSKISEITELKKSIKMTLGQCQNTKKTATATANIADKKKVLKTGKNATVTKVKKAAETKVKDDDERKADLEEIKSRLSDATIKTPFVFNEKDNEYLKDTKNFDFTELKAEIAAFKAEKNKKSDAADSSSFEAMKMTGKLDNSGIKVGSGLLKAKTKMRAEANVDKDKPFEDEKDLKEFDELNSAYEVGKDFSFDEEYLKEFDKFNLTNLKSGVANFKRDINKDLKMDDTKKSNYFNETDLKAELDSSEAMKKNGPKAGKEVLKKLPMTKMGAEANVDKDKSSEDSKNFEFDEMKIKNFTKKNSSYSVNKDFRIKEEYFNVFRNFDLTNIKAKIDNFQRDIIKDLKNDDAKINKILDEAELDFSKTMKKTGLKVGKEALKNSTKTKMEAEAGKISEDFDLEERYIKDFSEINSSYEVNKDFGFEDKHFKEFKNCDLANLNDEKANFKRDKKNFDEACLKAEMDSPVAMEKMGKADTSGNKAGIKDHKNFDSNKKGIKDLAYGLDKNFGFVREFELTDLKAKIAKNKRDIKKKFDEIKKNENVYEATNKDETNHFEATNKNGKPKSSALKEEFATLKAKNLGDLDAIELEKYQILSEMGFCEDETTEDIVYGESRDFNLDEINTNDSNDYSKLKSYYVFDEDGDDDDNDDEFLGNDKKLDFSLLDEDEENENFKMFDIYNFDEAELESFFQKAIQAEELGTKECTNSKEITAIEKNFELEINEPKDIDAAVADCKKTKNFDEAALKAELNSSKAEDIGINASQTKAQE